MKKKLILLSFILLVASYAFSQDEKMWVGGSFSFGTLINDAGATTVIATNVNFAPEFGIFVLEDLAVGGKFGITSNSTSAGNTSTSNQNVTLTPYVRYSLMKLGGFRIFGQGELPIGLTGNVTVGLNVMPVVVHSLYKNFSLSATLPSVFSFNTGNDTVALGLNLNTNFTPARIGITYKF